MSRNARMYLRRKDALIKKLGGRCALEGEGCEGELEFDHPNGRDYFPSSLASHLRIKQYEQDARDGNLRLLCKGHNTKDGGYKGAGLVGRSETGRFHSRRTR